MIEQLSSGYEDVLEHVARLATTDVLNAYETRMSGLTTAESEARLTRYGKNIISENKGKPVILVFLSNFISLMAVLLWIGGAIALFADMLQLGLAIWLVNIINGVFSFWQENRAEKATEALKKMLPSYAKVIRDGREVQLLAEVLVPGDIIVLQEGDKISADARLLDSSEFQADQSTLTGESNPVRKYHEPVSEGSNTPAELSNLVFAGTNVASGTATAVILSTGMTTELGKIAGLTQKMDEERSPLQRELDKLTRQVSIMAIIAGALFFIASVFIVRDPVAKSFIFSLGMIVAFIPEGLLPTVTLSLAMAVQRMARQNALVKRLSAVETLGCTTVICSDKTGTLTQNEMTVSKIWLSIGELSVTGKGYAPVGNILSDNRTVTADDYPDLKRLLTAVSLCSNARTVEPETTDGRYTVIGDPTEACLGVAAQKGGLDIDLLRERLPRIKELPFDSRRKRMSTIHQLDRADNGYNRVAFIKGAPKEVLALSTHIYNDGAIHDLEDTGRGDIMRINDQYAGSGLRVLAVACRYLDESTAYTTEDVEKNLIFIGLIAMADPPRQEVTSAVALCHAASIQIIMITGDYGLTAESIARQIGIIRGEKPLIITGPELDQMTDEALQEALKQEIIFARAAPEQKYRIVSILQQMGHIVAVTGDGVNDAPALKKADIGVAMGIIGTDVAKEAADMILIDDNFASIVRAIEEGRAVYSNIRKFMLYILNSNMPEAVPSAVFLFSKGIIPLPLTVMQILSVDLGTDMLPALGLGTELPEDGVMSLPPRSQKEPLLNSRLFFKAFLWYGLLESVFSLGAYFYVNWLNGWPSVPLAASGHVYSLATTMSLAAIVFCQIAMVLNCRTVTSSVFKIGLFKNKRVLLGIVCEIAILCMLSYIPFFHSIFNTTPLGLSEWIYLLLLPLPVLLLEEARKKVVRRMNARKAGL